MSEKLENPPAFPCQEMRETAFSGQSFIEHYSGMTLRDYFAAAALQGLCARGERDVALKAYYYADAMLKERQNQINGQHGEGE